MSSDADLVERMAKKHMVSRAAVEVVVVALRSAGGRMAQFSHGDSFSIADAALFYVERRAAQVKIDLPGMLRPILGAALVPEGHGHLGREVMD